MDRSGAAKSGGVGDVLARSEHAASAIVVDGERAYRVTTRAVRSMPETGGGVVSLLSDTALSSVLAQDDPNVFCAATEVGEILRVSKSDASSEAVVSGQRFGLGILGLAVDVDGVYFTNHFDASVVFAPLGGTIHVVASAQPAPYGVAVHGGNLFWSRNNNHGAR